MSSDAVTRVCASCGAELAPPPVVLLRCACGADLSAPDAVVTLGVSTSGGGVRFGVDVGPGHVRRQPKHRGSHRPK